MEEAQFHRDGLSFGRPLVEASFRRGVVQAGHQAVGPQEGEHVGHLGIAAFQGLSQFSGRERPPDHRSPLDIAKERYARGEITREQLGQIKKDLY